MLEEGAGVDKPSYAAQIIEQGFKADIAVASFWMWPQVVGSPLADNTAACNPLFHNGITNVCQLAIGTVSNVPTVNAFAYTDDSNSFQNIGGSQALTPSAWNRIELGVKIGAGTSGWVEIRVNGARVVRQTGINVNTNAAINLFKTDSTRESSTKYLRVYWDDYERDTIFPSDRGIGATRPLAIRPRAFSPGLGR